MRCCKATIKVKHKKGPLPLYCSQRCRQRAYERRRYMGPMVALQQDIAHIRVREVIREELWLMLRQLGIVPPKSPLPARPKPRHQQPNLRIVQP